MLEIDDCIKQNPAYGNVLYDRRGYFFIPSHGWGRREGRENGRRGNGRTGKRENAFLLFLRKKEGTEEKTFWRKTAFFVEGKNEENGVPSFLRKKKEPKKNLLAKNCVFRKGFINILRCITGYRPSSSRHPHRVQKGLGGKRNFAVRPISR